MSLQLFVVFLLTENTLSLLYYWHDETKRALTTSQQGHFLSREATRLTGRILRTLHDDKKIGLMTKSGVYDTYPHSH